VSVNPQTQPPGAITHAVYPVNRSQKTKLLLTIMEQTQVTSVLVFTATKDRAELVLAELSKAGRRAGVLHGDHSQHERTQALSRFRQGKTQILVATDIASRGLDIEDISHVVNYDVPKAADDYIHRIGRTARAEAKGSAFTLVSPEEEQDIKRIEGHLSRSLPRVTLPDFPYERPRAVVRRGGGLVGGESEKRTGMARWPRKMGRRR
jgi:ATP-dependent RNA helicase RhlE